MIYFIRRENDGLIKIGYTAAFVSRLRSLNREYQTILEVLGVMEGDRSVEAGLHGRFSDSRVEGEWFDPSRDLLDYIKASASAWDGNGERPVRLDLAPEVHQLLRIAAAHRGVSMTALARDFIERATREEAAVRGLR